MRPCLPCVSGSLGAQGVGEPVTAGWEGIKRGKKGVWTLPSAPLVSQRQAPAAPRPRRRLARDRASPASAF